MDLELAGKRALVTGSTSGIGAGVARMLAAEGCVIVVHGRDADRAKAVADSLKGTRVVIALGDLSTDAGADAVAASVDKALGGLDILVNNAGGAVGTSVKAWLDVDEKEWVATYEMNAVAAARMIRRFLPGMKARSWGRIIQIASAAGSRPIPLGPDYGAAKGAMINMTVSLASALGNCGVTVNTVSPGVILTPAVEAWLAGLIDPMGWRGLDRTEVEARLTSGLLQVPVGRIGRVEDIAHAVCMLASPNAGFMMGANIRVDGGQVQGVN